MSNIVGRPKHMTTAGDSVTFGGTGAGSILVSITVGTGAASAVVTVKDGGSGGATFAIIDASAKGSYIFNAACKDGLYATLSGGNADVTVVAQ